MNADDSDGYPYTSGPGQNSVDGDLAQSTDRFTFELTLSPGINDTQPPKGKAYYEPASAGAVALLFPDSEHDSLWNMPGAFHPGDSMDLDHLPPFTVALDMYFDANTPTGTDDHGTTAGGPRPPSSLFAPRLSPLGGSQQPLLVFSAPGDPLDTAASQFNSSQGFQMVPDDTLRLFPEFLAQFGAAQPDISGYTENMGHGSVASQTPAEIGGDADTPWLHSQRPLILATADLLPLTTTTSLTPSVSSVHSTQPSFFSAHQYLRSSFDAPRTSLDMYSRQRVSMDSQTSGIPAPPRNRSLVSYFPFMGDRKLPGSPAGDWNHAPNQNLRHLIRSIFKSSDDTEGTDPSAQPRLNTDNPENGDQVDFGDDGDFFTRAFLEEEEEEPPKKAKRTRRNLFTRFKTKQDDEELARQESRSSAGSNPSMGGFNGMVNNNTNTSGNMSGNMSGNISGNMNGNSNANMNANANGSNFYNNLASANIGIGSGPLGTNGPGFGANTTAGLTALQNMTSGNLDEPDYAALFHGVGKRRTIMKNKKSKDKDTKVEVKTEPHDDMERLTLDMPRMSQDNSSARLGDSGPLSQASSASAEGASFASASKRILGSRLLKRKTSAKLVSAVELDVVEIDLQLLDLPPNTEILSEINPRSRTRGRKEDKAADMEDQAKIFVCGYCSRRFKRQEHLKRHFRSLHTSEKPYECPICRKKFSRTDNLNQHLKVHKQEDEAAEDGEEMACE